MKIKKMLNSSFVRGVIVLASGTAAAQLIGLLSSPIITRLYGPEAFGLMGVFAAFVAIFKPISALTYPIAIVLPRDDRNAIQIIKLSLCITLFVSSVLYLFLILFNNQIIKLFNLNDVSIFLYLVPLTIGFAGIMQIVDQWIIRKKKFIVNAKVSLIQSFAINSGKIGVGYFHPFASVLIIFTAFTDAVRTLLLSLFLYRSPYDKKYDDNEKKLSIKQTVLKYKDFPLFRAPEVLLNSVSQRLPVLMLTTFFGPAAAGFYTLGNTVLQQPIRLIGNSVGDVFYPRIVEAEQNNESLSKLIIKATFILGLIGIIPFMIIVLIGPWIFSIVFGSDWFIAGRYAQWLGIFLFFEFINKPSIKALPVLSAQLFHLIITTIMTVVRIASLCIGFFIFNNDVISIALFSLSSAFIHLILILIVIYKSKKFEHKYLY